MGGLIPLSDASRRPRNFPVVTATIIAINAVVFFLELGGGDAFVDRWSLVPANIVAGQHWITILTAMFMHASWSHIIGNMIFFWAFGPEIEDAMNPFRYAIFYLAGGLAATAAQIAVDPHSTVPNLGASGAIAAVMGAFLVTFPRDKIKSVLFIGWFGRITMIPAFLLIGFWFLIQLVSYGVITHTPTTAGSGGGVAYMAHIGGMAFGALVARLIEDPDRIAAQRAFSDYEN
ncbi:MAG TPA: rhomboid family intramembrane serine protease [Candidatus Acidoferrum sp.]|nr:rhomboid family intramembrane serine protease [Candidatus Acidoferrum sp.]